MIFCNRNKLFYTFAIIALILAVFSVKPRWMTEKNNKSYGFIANYRDMLSLSITENISVDQVWSDLSRNGVVGITAMEYTGNDISAFHPVSSDIKPLGLFIGEKAAGDSKDNAVLSIDKSSLYAEQIENYLKIKLRNVKRIDAGDKILFVLPSSVDSFASSSILPDFDSLAYGTKNNIPVLFRVGTCHQADGNATAEALRYLIDNYSAFKNLLPTGYIIAGNPNVGPIAQLLKEKNISYSQTEFFRLIGASSLVAKAYPNIIPFHSLTADEIVSKNISRRQTVERFVRAVQERSVKLILMRPYELQLGNKYKTYLEDLNNTKTALDKKGFKNEWPEPFKPWNVGIWATLAMAIVFVATIWRYICRLLKCEQAVISKKEAASLLVAMAVIFAVLLKLPAAVRLLGGLCGGFIAAEAGLSALEKRNKPWYGLFIIVVGGLCIAAFYGTAKAALRLTPFAGVKLTLLLPPLLILLHDLKLRIHPESIKEIVVRPSLWGELFVLGLMMIALLIMAVRSGNVSGVPGWEVVFRDLAEKIFVVRPRTKEFMIGYPALVVYWYLEKHNFLPNYREAVRIAASLAFCSAINTFCHFHTILSLSIIRVCSGWCLGLIVGIIAVAILSLLRKLYLNVGKFGNTVKQR